MNRIDKWLDIGYKNSSKLSYSTIHMILNGLLQDDTVPNADFVKDMLDLSFAKGYITAPDMEQISAKHILNNWLDDYDKAKSNEELRDIFWHYCEHYIELRLNVKDEWR